MPAKKPEDVAVDTHSQIYTVHPQAPGAARPPTITVWIVVAEPFSANPAKTAAITLPDEYEEAEDFFFAASSVRSITFLPGKVESDEYGKDFRWDDYVDKDFTQPPRIFSLASRGTEWFRTADAAKSALLAGCLRLAESEIERLKAPRRETPSDVERAA